MNSKEFIRLWRNNWAGWWIWGGKDTTSEDRETQEYRYPIGSEQT